MGQLCVFSPWEEEAFHRRIFCELRAKIAHSKIFEMNINLCWHLAIDHGACKWHPVASDCNCSDIPEHVLEPGTLRPGYTLLSLDCFPII